MLTHERLTCLLDYSIVTGRFYWRVKPSKRVLAGARAGRKPAPGVRYPQIQIDGTYHLAHRLAWLYLTGAWPPAEIDHQNGDGWCNGWHNLRDATRGENMQNTAARGVTFRKGMWEPRLKVGGKSRYLGRFVDLADAIEARRVAKAQHHKFNPEVRA